MKATWIALFAMLFAFATACGDDDDNDTADGGGDADSDSDNDADADADADGDADADSDSDSDTGACTSTLLGQAPVTGTCQAEADPCEGGTSPDDAQGSCGDGEVCCIDTNQCASALVGMAQCQDTQCALGMNVGCPNNGWCCVTPDVPGTTAGEGDTCSLTFVGMIPFSGTCTPDTETCPAGTIPDFEAANCDTGLQCCIADDQCEMTGIFQCEATQCEMGFNAGCPSGGWCCFGGMPTT